MQNEYRNLYRVSTKVCMCELFKATHILLRQTALTFHHILL